MRLVTHNAVAQAFVVHLQVRQGYPYAQLDTLGPESPGLLLDVCDQRESYAMLTECRQHGQPPEVDMRTFLMIADTPTGLIIEQR